MSHWKSICKGVAFTFAALHVGGSLMEQGQRTPGRGTIDLASGAVALFGCVVALHGLLWRYIIPPETPLPLETKRFFFRGGRGFFGGSIGIGYLLVALHCFTVYHLGSLPAGSADRVPSEAHFLPMGLFWIGLGTAARLRDAFAELRAGSARPALTVELHPSQVLEMKR